jgi:hypothetical protein
MISFLGFLQPMKIFLKKTPIEGHALTFTYLDLKSNWHDCMVKVQYMGSPNQHFL